MQSKQIAIVMSEVFLRRLTPSLIPFVRRKYNFRIVSIHRPKEELKALLRKIEPDGLITEWLPDVTEGLLGLGLPTVIADTDYIYPGAVISVDVDDREVGAEAAQAFIQAGYRSFACLGNRMPYSDQRIAGFVDSIGFNVPVHNESSFSEARYNEHFSNPSRALKEWLSQLPKPVAVFAAHDPLGRFLCSACQQLGLDVPESVAVIGANNDELVCGLSYPMLSSVSIPWSTIGATVAESMQLLLNGDGAPDHPLLVSPSGVVLRHSANHLVVEEPILRRAMSYLSERFQDNISIGQMCGELRLARRGLERLFREYYNCTPSQMLTRLRVNRAKQLLTETNHPISVVSELCGFNDPERLAVVFKRETGKPPSTFRKGD